MSNQICQIPAVDWIIQFDPPDDPRDYIHRVGRTARGSNGKGRSLMFLQPSEVGFLKHLKEARVPVVEFEFPSQKIVNVQSQLEKLIGQNYYLNKVSFLGADPSSVPYFFFLTPIFANQFTSLLICACFILVGQGRLPCIPSSLCVPLSSLCLRREQA